ncbi:MAG: cation:proton antiporter, partial [Pseudomonadota bacterium]
AAKADEVFTATALLVVVGAALAMEAVGLSMAMGAFIAGVLLAESPFRHQVETDIEPFRGLFMGLFFIAVGMNLDLELVADHILLIVFSGVALVIMKAVLIFLLARAAGSDRADAIRIAAVLCQGGEFGFVLFGEALNAQVMSVANAPLLNAVVTLSMAATPLAVLIGQRLATRVAPPEADEDMDGVKRIEDAPEETKGAPIIVAGFGRAGQVVAQLLRMRGYAVTLIDNNPRRIRIAESFGAEVFFGDARRLDVLATADADAAQAIFLCLNDREGARLALERIRDRFPNTKVYAMTYDRFSMMELEQAGAHHVARETFESALALASEALRDFGDGDAIEDLVEEFRRRDAQLLKSQADFGAHEGLRKLRETYSLESTDDGVERTPQRDG